MRVKNEYIKATERMVLSIYKKYFISNGTNFLNLHRRKYPVYKKGVKCKPQSYTIKFYKLVVQFKIYLFFFFKYN